MALEPHEKLVGYHPKAFHQKTAGLRLNAKKRHRLVKEFAENLEFHLKERQRQRQQQQKTKKKNNNNYQQRMEIQLTN